MTLKLMIAVMAGLALSACDTPIAISEPELVQRLQTAPPGAEPGSCWGKDISPAVVETVTEQVLLQPAEVRSDGTVAQPAVYKTETKQMIVRERRETWFETPCSVDLTQDFNASVQRALKARGHYRGPINGEMDARTRAAIRAFQKPQGLDSGILSIAAARQLGLIAVEIDDAG
ncbi:MAG: peptidoglycan-binding domain-containing protein [Pseudomonadota bacterium]